jgi:hypothetical protein
LARSDTARNALRVLRAKIEDDDGLLHERSRGEKCRRTTASTHWSAEVRRLTLVFYVRRVSHLSAVRCPCFRFPRVTQLTMFTEYHRWIGNYVVPLIGLAVLFYQMRRKHRPLWLTGAMIATGMAFLVFACFWVHDLSWKPKPGAWVDFPPTVGLIWYSALPIQTPFNWLLGEDNFVEEHLLIPTAILTWSLAGAAIGAMIAKFKNWLHRKKQREM